MGDLQNDYEHNNLQSLTRAAEASLASTVRAKFRCTAKLPAAYNSDTLVHLSAVYSSDPKSENKAFTDATPSAYLQMQIAAGKPAADLFVLGQDYYLDFTPCV